jgi:hypothetical protein
MNKIEDLLKSISAHTIIPIFLTAVVTYLLILCCHFDIAEAKSHEKIGGIYITTTVLMIAITQLVIPFLKSTKPQDKPSKKRRKHEPTP